MPSVSVMADTSKRGKVELEVLHGNEYPWQPRRLALQAASMGGKSKSYEGLLCLNKVVRL